LTHPSENGDGVRGRIVSSRTGLAGEWVAQHGNADTNTGDLPVEVGDTIDFITDCRENVTSDSFSWTATLMLIREGKEVMSWKSVEGFHGPQPASSAPLDAAQVIRAWQLTLCRPPSREELQLAIRFLNGQIEALSAQPRPLPKNVSVEQQALTNLCQTLLSANEFLYIE
jgi:hypothetical protein